MSSSRLPWRHVADMSPEQLVFCVDFTCLTDALAPNEALDLFTRYESPKQPRVDYRMRHGYPASRRRAAGRASSANTWDASPVASTPPARKRMQSIDAVCCGRSPK